jgi:hypothetical protein
MQLLNLICALTLLIAVPAVTACDLINDADSSEDPLNNSGFLAAVEEVENAGLTPYWLGKEFRVGAARFALFPETEIISPLHKSPGLELWYEGGVTTTAPLYVESHTESAGEADFFRDQLAGLPGTHIQQVRVGRWDAELYTLQDATRPVNQLWLFVDTGNVVVLAKAHSVRNGIPGQDPNPLIDEDLLISVMAEHLRPIPE